MFSSLAAWPHGFALGDLFDYEDEDHIVIITNLNENSCNLNMKVVDFEGLVCQHCSQSEEDVANIKEEVMSLFLPS